MKGLNVKLTVKKDCSFGNDNLHTQIFNGSGWPDAKNASSCKLDALDVIMSMQLWWANGNNSEKKC